MFSEYSRSLNMYLHGIFKKKFKMIDDNRDELKRAERCRFFAVERDHIKPKRAIKHGKSYSDLPCRTVVQMTTDALAADTGPEGGIQCLSVKKKWAFDYFHCTRLPVIDPIAGIRNWNMHHFRAYGLSQSLYDWDPVTQALSGEPNADAFAVVARENNAFLAVADGVNWGEKPFMAARSAVKGCIEYLSDRVHKACNTQEIAKVMLCSFKHAQSCIIDNQATLTTLCAAVVCKLQDIDCYGLCVVNVGDSLAYVYRKEGLHVEEVTYGSHENEIRDMRTTGGCLGPSDGYNPDLTNLTCSFTFVEEGDIVFLTTDGISDNFDPVVLKKSTDVVKTLINPVQYNSKSEEDLLPAGHVGVTAKKRRDEFKRPRSHSEPPDSKTKSKPPYSSILTTDERRNYACALMKQKIESESPCGQESSAKELCANLMNFVVNETTGKRTILENGAVKPQLRHQLSKKKPGKLDHATVVAYEIGHFEPAPLKLVHQDNRGQLTPTERPDDANLVFYPLFGLLK